MHTGTNRDVVDHGMGGITRVFDDTLRQLTTPESADKPQVLPSWPDTVALLHDLHGLLLTPMDQEDARATLNRVVKALETQLEICARTDNVSTLVSEFLAELPGIKQALVADVHAALRCDPAAVSGEEIALCYPGMRALAIYRVAHVLYQLEVPLLPRLMTEIGHSASGIDIHPGAKIGRRFFIDHGTGIVIGATCVIGNDVKIYQGVTLGARSFPQSTDGRVIRDQQRHPSIGDNVTIFAGATILGRV
ncbi:MAG: hypothetical protein OQJ84_12405, partial [Xanthomonadales bacterium]|nr:hypothetical protein [Xanthomonadales bacterium]